MQHQDPAEILVGHRSLLLHRIRATIVGFGAGLHVPALHLSERPLNINVVSLILFADSFFFLGWGLLPGSLELSFFFFLLTIRVEKHELTLWPGGEVWLRHYCHSQVCQSPACPQEWIFIQVSPVQLTKPPFFFPPTSSWPFYSWGLENGAVFWAPSARLALGQLLGVSAGGFGEAEGRAQFGWKGWGDKKREGSSAARPRQQTRQGLLFTQTVPEQQIQE